MFNIILQQKCHIKPDDVVVVGVSGGADSIYLAQTLLDIHQPIIIAHYNHGIRSAASADADFVKWFADEHGVPFVLEEGNVYDFAKQGKMSLEAASRFLRYNFLFRVAEECEAKAVAVAHHADDQVETLLLNLLRGTGLRGLIGMSYRSLPNPWSQSIPLVRPLLGLFKDDIVIELNKRRIPFRTDETNKDTTFLRNRIRHEIIPVLSSARPDIKSRMLQLAESLHYDYQYIQERVEEATNGVVFVDNGYVYIDQSRFNSLHIALQRHTIVKILYERFFSDVEIDLQVIENILEWMNRSTGTERQVISGNLLLYREGGKVFLYTPEAEGKLPLEAFPLLHSSNDEILLSVPDKVPVGDGWQVTVKVIEFEEDIFSQIKSKNDEYTAYLGFKDKPTKFLVRSRRPGDRFAPLGMGGATTSLKKYMINQKIPRRVRSRYPIFLYRGNIMWVPGYGISHKYRVATDSRWVCVLTMRKL